MSSPQDPRARRRQKELRAKKHRAWQAARAKENAEAAKPKASAKKAA